MKDTVSILVNVWYIAYSIKRSGTELIIHASKFNPHNIFSIPRTNRRTRKERSGQVGSKTFSSCDKSVYGDIEGTSAIESDEVHKVLKSILTNHFSDLSNQLNRCLSRVSASMYSKKLISESVRDSPTVYNIIGEFESGMRLASNISKLQEHCQLFLQCLSSEGGPTELAAQKLSRLDGRFKKQCDISLDLTCDEQDIIQQGQ